MNSIQLHWKMSLCSPRYLSDTSADYDETNPKHQSPKSLKFESPVKSKAYSINHSSPSPSVYISPSSATHNESESNETIFAPMPPSKKQHFVDDNSGSISKLSPEAAWSDIHYASPSEEARRQRNAKRLAKMKAKKEKKKAIKSPLGILPFLTDADGNDNNDLNDINKVKKMDGEKIDSLVSNTKNWDVKKWKQTFSSTVNKLINDNSYLEGQVAQLSEKKNENNNSLILRELFKENGRFKLSNYQLKNENRQLQNDLNESRRKYNELLQFVRNLNETSSHFLQ